MVDLFDNKQDKQGVLATLQQAVYLDAETKNGLFQIVLKSGDKDGIKYSFVPLTDKIDESKMVIRIIGKSE